MAFLVILTYFLTSLHITMPGRLLLSGLLELSVCILSPGIDNSLLEPAVGIEYVLLRYVTSPGFELATTFLQFISVRFFTAIRGPTKPYINYFIFYYFSYWFTFLYIVLISFILFLFCSSGLQIFVLSFKRCIIIELHHFS